MLGSIGYFVVKVVAGVFVVLGPLMVLWSLLGMLAGAGGYDVNASAILANFFGGVIVFLFGYIFVTD